MTPHLSTLRAPVKPDRWAQFEIDQLAALVSRRYGADYSLVDNRELLVWALESKR